MPATEPLATIAETTLKQMEGDADRAKSELHLAVHVRTLVAEVRRLSERGEAKPTLEQAQVALAVANVLVDGSLRDKANTVLDRFLS